VSEMYLTFYGLREKPFATTPDPRFLYHTERHREALAQLAYGVREQKGFMVLTGEVGTGKTTLLRALLQRLDGTAVAFVFNSLLPFDELLEYILEDFGISKVGESRAQRLVALNTFLLERRRAGQNTVLIIDEAQNLSVATLEQIRLLSNFETSTDKLLQIVLAGQPELRSRLEQPELRQLRQRVGLQCDIRPLSRTAIGDYIRTRLRIAGAQDPGLFADEAMRRIGDYTGGLPRRVNIVCDHALLMGYAARKRRVTTDLVDEVIAYLEGEEGEKARWWTLASWRAPRWGWIAGVVGAIVVGLLLAVRLPGEVLESLGGGMESMTSHLLDLVRIAKRP